jgi:hypothetical protein
VKRRFLIVTSALALLAASCGGESRTTPLASASPAPVSTATPGPSASDPPSPSPALPVGEQLSVRVIGDGPVIIGDVDGPDGYPNDYPGAIVRGPNGAYHLYIAWFAATPGDEIVTHARSTDAVDWAFGTEPVYEDLGLEMRYPGPMPAEALLVDDTWVMYGWGASIGAQRADGSWRATAPDPAGPWAVDPAMSLEAGAPGAWDGGGAVASAVVATPDGFLLWYEGYPERPGPESIGLATSMDGVAFTKETDPAIPAGACGSAADAAVFQPNVLATEDGYLMLFGGLEEIGGTTKVFGATSQDGRTWECAGEGPLPGLEQFSGSNYVHTFQTFDRDGQPSVLLEILRGDHTELWLAEIDRG